MWYRIRSGNSKLCIVVTLPLESGRYAANGVADSAVVPVAYEISEHQALDLFHGHSGSIASAIDGLGLEAGPHALTFCIVMAATAIGVHALHHTKLLQACSEIGAGILAAPVGVENSTGYSVEIMGRKKALHHQGWYVDGCSISAQVHPRPSPSANRKKNR